MSGLFYKPSASFWCIIDSNWAMCLIVNQFIGCGMCGVDWLKLGLCKPVSMASGMGSLWLTCNGQGWTWELGRGAVSFPLKQPAATHGGQWCQVGHMTSTTRASCSLWFFSLCGFLFGDWLWYNTVNGALRIGLPPPNPPPPTTNDRCYQGENRGRDSMSHNSTADQKGKFSKVGTASPGYHRPGVISIE